MDAQTRPGVSRIVGRHGGRDADCTIVQCGDGVLNTVAEDCDDGNTDVQAFIQGAATDSWPFAGIMLRLATQPANCSGHV